MMNRRRSIKYHFMGVIAFIILVCISSAYLASILNTELYNGKVQYLTEVAEKGADIILTKVEDSFAALKGVSTFLSDGYPDDPEKMMELLAQESNQNDFKRMGIVSLDGIATVTDGHTFDFSDRNYFKQAKKGTPTASDVLVDKFDNKEIIVFAVPMTHDDEVISVLFATRNVETFSKLVSVQSFGGEGFSYVIKQNGSPITHTEHKNSIGKYTNLFNALRREASNHKAIDKFEADVKSGLSGTIRTAHSNVSRETSYMPIGVNDWFIVSVVPTKAIFSESDNLVILMLATGMLIFLSIIYLCFLLVRYSTINNKQLSDIAYIDTITGYSNWKKFELDSSLLLKKNIDKKYAMVIFDIDHFKVINDIYGHQRGNEILKAIGDILNENTSSYETFARSSSDNFNVLMVYETDSDIIERVHLIADKTASFIEEYTILLSFGIYLISTNMPNISILSDRATMARHKIKGKTDSLYSFFDEKTRKRILDDNEIETGMESALKHNEFEVYLQPKFSFKTGKIVGAEALCRWNRPEKGLLSPIYFIPLFEKNGFIRKLDEYMFEKVCILLNDWKSYEIFNNQIAISVNLSRAHLSTTALVARLTALTQKYDVSTSLIEVEITESAVFEDTQKLITIMEELKSVGFSISIDDFGSGYSSLNMLKDLPVDTIKMDKGFLDEATDDDRAKLIIGSLIQMTKKLDLETVAEGVETIGQVEFLKNAGCDKAQGFYYAKPMPIPEFEALFKRINFPKN